jgi:hypothetical protein
MARAGGRDPGGNPLRWNRDELYAGREKRWKGQELKEDSDAAGAD